MTEEKQNSHTLIKTYSNLSVVFNKFLSINNWSPPHHTAQPIDNIV